MKILYITHTFFPETLAVERGLSEVLELIDLGHEVTVLTAMPSYPLGRIFDGYRGRMFMRERVRGIEVVRVRAFSHKNAGIVARLLCFASFSLAAMVAGLFMHRRELVMAAIPSPGTELAGIVIARLKASQLLLELIDVLPDNLAMVGVPKQSLKGKLLLAYYRMAYRKADWIAVLCPAAGEVVAEMGVDPHRILLLPNGVDPIFSESIAPDQVRQKHGLAGKFVVVYAGSFSPYYRVQQIVAAACLLRETHPQIHFLLMGGGGQWGEVNRTVIDGALRNVTLTGILPREQMSDYLQVADLFVFSFVGQPTPHSYHGIIQAKACDYLWVGRPILAVEDGSILAGLLERIGAGMHVEPTNPVKLAEAITHYKDDPERCRQAGLAARDYAQRQLPRQKVVREFEQSLMQRMAMQASSMRVETRESMSSRQSAALAIPESSRWPTIRTIARSVSQNRNSNDTGNNRV